MADELVKAYDVNGNRVLVPKGKLAELEDLGGRVATPEDIAQAKLEDEYAKASTASKVAGALTGIGARMPQLEAWHRGGASGLTAGIYEGAVRQAVQALAGKKAGAAYEEHTRDLRTAYGDTYKAGEVAGMLGGAAIGAASAGTAGAAARLLPSAGISAVGGAVEAGVGRALGGVAARGVLGRAAASAASLGAQGLVEGALYGAAQEVGESMLGDHEVAADKLFAATGSGALYGALGGVALGGAGSLAKSGAVAVGRKAASGLARMAEGAAARTATRAAEEEGAAAVRVADSVGLPSRTTRTLKDAADDLAFDALGTTRKVGDKINAKVKGGTRAVGEYVNREILKVAEGDVTAQRLLTGGRSDELLPLIQANRAAKGQAIGKVVEATPTRVKVADIVGDADAIFAKMRADPTQIQGADAFRQRVAQTFEAFKEGGLIAEDGTMALSDVYYARAKLEGVAHEMGRKTAAEASVKEWLRNLDGHLVDKLDEAAKAMGKTGEREKLVALKRDYQLASWAERAAEDGSNRIASNNIFGLREGIAAGVGLATAIGSDDPMLGVLGAGATALGGRFLRQRGAAAGALMLARMAEMGTITRAMQSVEAQVGKASKGLLSPAPAATRSAAPRPARDPVKVARRATKQLAELSARPEAVLERAETVTSGLSTTAPNVAGKVAQNLTRALAFLNSKLPPNPHVDPLAPRRERSWTPSQAERFARYVEAAEDPMGVLEDFERGKITPEAVETLRVLTPTLYRELQERTLDGIAEQLASGKPIGHESRLRLGTLLGIEADPSQSPRVRAWLQGNIAGSAKAAGGGTMQSPQGQPAPGPAHKPIKLNSQHSAFDRLAESGPGRR